MSPWTPDIGVYTAGLIVLKGEELFIARCDSGAELSWDGGLRVSLSQLTVDDGDCGYRSLPIGGRR